MFCPKCGTQLNDDAKFCSKCGIKIQEGLQDALPDDSSASTRSRKTVLILVVIGVFCLLCMAILWGINVLTRDREDEKLLSTASNQETNINSQIICGVYTKMGWYQDLDDPHGHTVKLCKYCVEFFDDGSAIWWENVKLYETPQYYVCQYHYNEGDNDITLIISDGNERTIKISVYEDYIMLTGEGFKNDVFRKGTYDDITEAVAEISEDYISAEDYEYINDH